MGRHYNRFIAIFWRNIGVGLNEHVDRSSDVESLDTLVNSDSNLRNSHGSAIVLARIDVCLS